MQSSLTTNETIRRAAFRLRVAVFAAMALMLVIYVAARFDLQMARTHIAYEIHAADEPFGKPIGDVSIALLMIALFRLTQMLGGIANGEMFSAAVIRSFRGFAFWLLLMALFGLFAPLVVGFAAASTGPRHQVRLVLNLRDLLTVGITLLLFLLASLLERARRLDEEMREFV